jgi:putative addiction module component (TIGR02574 family)
MSQTAEALSAQALRLPPDERLALVEHLLDSLDVPDTSLEALWTAEANERLAAYRRGEIRAIPLSDVLAKYQVANRSA